jgi:predicted signal transduction protein with EAL and GGDEF domain
VQEADVSAMLESLLHACGDTDRLADIARNDALAGIAPPPVEMDEVAFLRADLAYAAAKRSGALDSRRLHRAHEAEVQRNGSAM